MQETIKQIMEAEQKASEIISAARNEAAALISAAEAEVTCEQNSFKEKELIRYNEAVEEALSEQKNILEQIKTSGGNPEIDLDAVSDAILKRVMTTIFN